MKPLKVRPTVIKDPSKILGNVKVTKPVKVDPDLANLAPSGKTPMNPSK